MQFVITNSVTDVKPTLILILVFVSFALVTLPLVDCLYLRYFDNQPVLSVLET